MWRTSPLDEDNKSGSWAGRAHRNNNNNNNKKEKKNVFERVYKEIKILMLLGKEIKYAAHCVRYANFRFPLRIACEGMEEIAWKIFYKKYFRKINDIDTLIEDRRFSKQQIFLKLYEKSFRTHTLLHLSRYLLLSASWFLLRFLLIEGKKKKKTYLLFSELWL